MVEVQTVEQEAASRLTTQEKLLLAQAVHKVGAANWPAISKLLVEHPCCKHRPGELFTPEACEAEYVGLMQSIGQNVPAEGGAKPQAKVHLRLAQTFYVARMEELKSSIAAIETRFTELVQEISNIKAGKLDAAMMTELRAVLERKYGKKLLDSWVPPPEDVVKAVEAGPPTQDELAKAAEPSPIATPVAEEPVVAEEEQPKIEAEEEIPVAAQAEEEEEEVAMVVEEDVKPHESPAVEEAKEPSPDPSVHSELTEPSSPPSPAAAPVSADSEPGPSTRRGKRKASLPPQEPPKSKRATRRGGNSPMPPPEVPSPVAEPEEEGEPEAEAEPLAEADEEDEPPRTSRRRSQRASEAKKESPDPSTRTRISSPAASRRTASVMSRQSATPVPEDKPKRGRPPRNSRGMRDEVVSKSVREQTVESVKEEEEEERPPTRATRKKAAAEETPAREEKKTRGSAKIGRDHAEDDASATGDVEQEEAEKDQRRETRASASEQPAETPGPSSRRAPRGSLPKEQKTAQKMLYSLLEQVNQHKLAPVFMNPVKKSDASDYYDIIKRPMDFKQIRTRIREGIITTIDECERDILLIFANAMMYNNEGTEVYEMAETMLKSVESTIAHFRSLQHDMSRDGR